MHAVVLVVDKIPLAQLGVYGNEWVNTPALDKLAYDGFVFDQCHAACPTSSQWLGAAVTGFPPYTWLVSEDHFAGLANVGPLATLLEQDVGTCRIARQSSRADASFGSTEIHPELSLEELLGRGLAWLDGQAERSALLWIDLAEFVFDGQIPAAVPESDLMQYLEEQEPLWPTSGPSDELSDADLDATRTTYAGAISWLDGCLARFAEGLTQRGRPVLLAITADSGLPLGEHGEIGTEGNDLFEERTHVPLLFTPLGEGNPSKIRAGARSPALVQPTDLAATLAEWFDVAVQTVEGKSLLGLMAGEPVKLRDFTCAALDDAIYSIRTHQWKLILPVEPQESADEVDEDSADQTAEVSDGSTGSPSEESASDVSAEDAEPEGVLELAPRMLFAKPEDRWEMNDLADQQLAMGDTLELQLRRYFDALTRGTLGFLTPMRGEGE